MLKSFPMKIFLTLCVLAIATIIYVNTQKVDFPDPRLEGLIREVSGKESGQIYIWHVSQIQILDAQNRGITDLRGLGRLRNLRRLNLEDNRIGDVSPLAALSKLEYLSLRNNGITSLEDIQFSSLKAIPLDGLSLRHNVVRYPDGSQNRLSDISALSSFQSLKFLELRDNHIGDVQPLSSLTNLEVLDISQNPVQDTHGEYLVFLVQLQELNLRETGIKSLQFLNRLPNLRYLNLHSNAHIISIAPITELHALEELILANVPIGDELRVLSSLSNLHRLNIRNCSIQDLEPLGRMMSGGVLQDQPWNGITAAVDLRDNPIFETTESGLDGYAPIRPYWENISDRNPNTLPQ
jgi:Leucine-rich repeat (LRR) protein